MALVGKQRLANDTTNGAPGRSTRRTSRSSHTGWITYWIETAHIAPSNAAGGNTASPRRGSGLMRRSTSAVDDLPRLDVDLVPSRSQRAHGVEAVFHHVAVELHAIAVGVVEVQAARHVVLDGRLHRD